MRLRAGLICMAASIAFSAGSAPAAGSGHAAGPEQVCGDRICLTGQIRPFLDCHRSGDLAVCSGGAALTARGAWADSVAVRAWAHADHAVFLACGEAECAAESGFPGCSWSVLEPGCATGASYRDLRASVAIPPGQCVEFILDAWLKVAGYASIGGVLVDQTETSQTHREISRLVC